jgi:hypothetical protein
VKNSWKQPEFAFDRAGVGSVQRRRGWGGRAETVRRATAAGGAVRGQCKVHIRPSTRGAPGTTKELETMPPVACSLPVPSVSDGLGETSDKAKLIELY